MCQRLTLCWVISNHFPVNSFQLHSGWTDKAANVCTALCCWFVVMSSFLGQASLALIELCGERSLLRRKSPFQPTDFSNKLQGIPAWPWIMLKFIDADIASHFWRVYSEFSFSVFWICFKPICFFSSWQVLVCLLCCCLPVAIHCSYRRVINWDTQVLLPVKICSLRSADLCGMICSSRFPVKWLPLDFFFNCSSLQAGQAQPAMSFQ